MICHPFGLAAVPETPPAVPVSPHTPGRARLLLAKIHKAARDDGLMPAIAVSAAAFAAGAGIGWALALRRQS